MTYKRRDKAYLFVYGTLLQKLNHPMHRVLTRHGKFMGPGRFQGRLYDLGSYPGAVASPQPSDEVRGELYRLKDPALVFQVLDEYEGAQFRREYVPIYSTNGKKIRSWIYIYQGPTSGLRLIAHGDYMKWCN